jgi:hypothetical protein
MLGIDKPARGIGLALPAGFAWLSAILLGWGSPTWAESPYLPDHALVPTITNNLGPSGAFGLPPLNPPDPPKNFDKEASWNMKVVGFMDQLGCQDGDQMWVEHQGNREILYAGSQSGTGVNPVTNQTENCGVQIYDVTDIGKPKFLAHIPGLASGGAPHVFVCSGNTLPHATAGGYYLLVHRGPTNSGDGRHEIWDVTNPSAPMLLTTIVGGLSQYHRSYWECDTGIAYLISGSKTDGWQEKQHIYIYDLSNPASPVFIRQYGIPGGQPSADVASQTTCTNSPGQNCYEGVANPPGGIHECYSTSTGVMSATGTKSVVICSVGPGSNGIIQILDRTKLLTGCTSNPDASAHCADPPTQSLGPSQSDLLYPQIGYLPQPPYIGSHNSTPIFNMPIPQAQANFTTSPLSDTLGPQSWDVMINTSEAGGPPTCGTSDRYMHNTTLVDITNEQTPWPISTLNVPQYPGDFCQKGGRFGSHYYAWHIYAPYYGKLACVTWFNAGMRCFDIRDPLNPRMVAYYIQAPNQNTRASCGVPGDPTVCRNVAYMNVIELDDRGYIYGQDRAGSGITVLQPTGEALQVVTQGSGGGPGQACQGPAASHNPNCPGH